jgi:hypothetical protein
VIDTDKKQLIEVEANSKDDLEKYENLAHFIRNFYFLSIQMVRMD